MLLTGSFFKSLPSPIKIEAVPFEKIISNPLASYHIFKSRREKWGLLTPFPEFASAVQHVSNALNDQEILRYCANKPELQSLRKSALTRLLSVQVTFKIEAGHPQRAPFKAPYPYLPTIEAIREGLTFLDAVIREKYNHLPALYHTERYLHHYDHIYNSNFIYVPCAQELSLNDFIRTRSVPISFLGVASVPVHADAYYNSPLDFFMHDVNHIRRLEGYNLALIKKHPELSANELYAKMDDFIKNTILPAIEITPELSLQEKNIRQIMAVLFFEHLHELAFTPDLDSFKDALLQEPGAPSPFEHLIDDEFDPTKIEKLRMANFNIDSGYSNFINKNAIPIVRFYFDKFPNFITSAYNKIMNNFFDTPEKRSPDLPPMAERNEDLFVVATVRLMQTIGLADLLGEEKIRSLLRSTTAQITYPEQSVPKPTSLLTASIAKALKLNRFSQEVKDTVMNNVNPSLSLSSR